MAKVENATFKERLEYDKLSFYYLSLPIMLLGKMLGALFLAALEYIYVDKFGVVVWLLLNFILYFYQLYHYQRFKTEDEENKLLHADIWLDKYYTNILLNGIIWGSSAIFLFPEHNMLYQLILMLFLFAIGFTAMGVLASKSDLVITYVLVMYGPLIARFFYSSDKMHMQLALMMIALVLLMIIIANYYGRIINNALSTRQHFIEIKHRHEKLKERFFTLFERAPVGIFYYNRALEIEDLNAHFVTITKAEAKEELIGLNLKALLHNEALQEHKIVFESKSGRYRGPLETPDKSETLYVNLSTVPMYNDENKIVGGISILNDIKGEVTAKEEMIRSAYYDILTKIPNRTLLMDRLEHLLKQSRDERYYGAVLLLDIDNFRKVNENFGHHVGDYLLQQVAKRIAVYIDEEDFFARVSDNKFVILLPKLGTEKEKSEQAVRNYINNLSKQFKLPLELSGNEYYLSFTAGVALFRYNGKTPYDLLKRAETAMHYAKKTAKGMFAFYSDDMGHGSKESLSIETDLHKAIKNGELFLQYLPQYKIGTDKVESAEALIRWHHPTRGDLPPRAFLRIAEESGTIVSLEKAIFRKIFSEIATLKRDADIPMPSYFTVNVSIMHFLQPYFEETILQEMQQFGISTHEVQIELPEEGIMKNLRRVTKKMKKLRSRGFRFSIDDFGTSHSLISALENLPVDTIKIDRRFVTHIYKLENESAIVKSIIAIGHSFGLTVVAEGVETEKTLQVLKRLDCDAYQGYLHGEPMEMEALMALLAHQKA